jgi:hypothetical protein
MTRKIIAVLFIVAITALSVGCLSDAPGPGAINPINYKVEDGCPVANYGNGVYYFPCVGENFLHTLSEFKGEGHNVTAISGDGTAGYGADHGYIVTCDEKKP